MALADTNQSFKTSDSDGVRQGTRRCHSIARTPFSSHAGTTLGMRSLAGRPAESRSLSMPAGFPGSRRWRRQRSHAADDWFHLGPGERARPSHGIYRLNPILANDNRNPGTNSPCLRCRIPPWSLPQSNQILGRMTLFRPRSALGLRALLLPLRITTKLSSQSASVPPSKHAHRWITTSFSPPRKSSRTMVIVTC